MSEILAGYRERWEALQEFQVKHHKLLSELEFLQELMEDATETLKAYAREHGSEEDEMFTVTVQPKTRKWFDADKVLELAPYVAQMPGVMEVNRERINQLVKAKALPEDVVTAAYREEALTSAVTIKRK